MKSPATFLLIAAVGFFGFTTVGCCGIVQRITDIGDLAGSDDEEEDSSIPDIPFIDDDDTARGLEKDAKEMEELVKEYERINADPNLSDEERERKLAEIGAKMEKKGEEMEKKAEEFGFNIE